MLLLAALLAALGLPFAAQAARAGTLEVDCAHLRGAVEAASATQTIVLDGMCGKSELGETGIAIPAGANLTLRGAPSTDSGIDGAGMSGALLISVEAGALAIEGLTFENAAPAGAVRLRAGRVAIVGDRFVANSSDEPWGAGLFVQATGPACPGAGGRPAISLLSSVFRGNTLTHDGEAAMGAGAYLADMCPGAGDAIEDDVFEGNLLRASNAEQAAGGGLFLGAEGVAPAAVAQSGNVFTGNRVEDLLAPHSYTGGRFGGGGEWLEGASLLSVRDRFSQNTVEGSVGLHPSGGAGLGVASGVGALESLQTVTCGHGALGSATLEDDAIYGNSITGATAAGADGAGVEIGCGEAGGQLSLLDSTVTANSSPAGGVAGVAGGPAATLTLANTILAWNTGLDFGDFGGSLSASHSDVCVAGGSAPFAGDHNLCADPQLAGGLANVAETALSPTREAGSNALVPAGLESDYYGQPRIAGGVFEGTCKEGVVEVAPPVVDIGAAEAQEALIRPLRVACPRPFTRSAFAFPAVRVRPGGVLLLTFSGLGKGTVLAQAHVVRPRPARRRASGHGRRARPAVPAFYGQAARAGRLPSTLLLRVRPTARALRALRSRRRLTISLSVTYAADRLFPATQSRTIAVTLRRR